MDRTVKSAARVLQVFELFAHRQAPATVSEVARALEFPVSSTSVLLKSLARLGYLEHRARSREYLPTIRFAVLGGWMLEGLFADEESAPHLMDELQQETEETIVLAMEHAPHVDYIRILQSIAPVRFHLRPGVRRPIWRAAAGKALLARWPDEKVERLLRTANAEPTNERVEIPSYLDSLATVRREGYAMTEEQITQDGAMIAMALPVGGERRPLAVAVCGPLERMRRKRDAIVAAMRCRIDDHFGLPSR